MVSMLPRPERLLPPRAQPVVALVVGAGLTAMAAWYVVVGGFSGGLVDHDSAPPVPLGFSLDVNSAGEAELAVLPGIGPALARRIVDHRAERGPFRTADDLLAVPGLGPITLQRVRPHLRPPAAGPAPPEPAP